MGKKRQKQKITSFQFYIECSNELKAKKLEMSNYMLDCCRNIWLTITNRKRYTDEK